MATFAQQVITDSEANFLDPLAFSEPITYTAKRPDYIEATAPPGSGDKAMSARVIRRDPNPGKSNGKRPFPVNGLRFYISRGALNGIETVTPNFDTIKLPMKIGEVSVKLTVKKVLKESISMWFLEAEK